MERWEEGREKERKERENAFTHMDVYTNINTQKWNINRLLGFFTSKLLTIFFSTQLYYLQPESYLCLYLQ